ncbi:MAG TPA: MXAN_6577-like cysteine-rich protein [Polyangiaceae bacterium]|nr:MXAN_6577-like cysteine-rich protein [Polyangiaceae bacterium]
MVGSVIGLGCGKADNEPEVALTTINGVACLDGAVACGDTCARLASSADHCGSCDNACGADAICDRGRCKPTVDGCSAALLLCGSDCVDTGKDREHCGSCTQTCPTDAECRSGSCECPGTLSPCGDACVDTSSDADHCGACGTSCFDTQSCIDGACQCPAGTELCGDTCVDTSSDGRNCGSCGNACVGGQVCGEGTCACPAGTQLCGDRCVDTTSSLEHCGSCGNACIGGQVCELGNCACPSGQALCDGTCTDTQSDNAHCGSCDVKCGLGQGCSTGACQSGAFGEDGCQGLAQSVSISEVAAYQTVKVGLVENGQAVANSGTRLVAQRPTLVRVLVTPGAGWVERELSARLYLENGETITTQYSESTLSLAAASQEDDRASSFEFKIPAELITDGTRFAAELVECGTGSGTAERPRVPATDGLELGAVETGGLKIRIIPLRSNGLLPDTSETALSLYRAAFLDTYPISSIEFAIGDPVDVADAEDWNANLDAVRALRQREAPAADIYYYGMIKPSNTLREFCGTGCTAGVGYVPNGRQNPGTRAAIGLAYADQTSAFTMLHEVAHNHGRGHAPCVQGGTISGVDPNFPQADGSIGDFGYNALGDDLISPDASDLMGYCRNQWLSAYTYDGILDTVLAVNRVQASELVSADQLSSWRVLLVDATRGPRWGIPIEGPAPAIGEAETALALDAAGLPVENVRVYRTRVSDLDASSIVVPEPKPGWQAIQVSGAPPIEFRHAP